MILDPQPKSNQHKNVITCRESPLAHAYKVWSTSINAFVSRLSCRQTDTQTHRHTLVITIPVPRLYRGAQVISIHAISIHCISTMMALQRAGRTHYWRLTYVHLDNCFNAAAAGAAGGGAMVMWWWWWWTKVWWSLQNTARYTSTSRYTDLFTKQHGGSTSVSMDRWAHLILRTWLLAALSMCHVTFSLSSLTCSSDVSNDVEMFINYSTHLNRKLWADDKLKWTFSQTLFGELTFLSMLCLPPPVFVVVRLSVCLFVLQAVCYQSCQQDVLYN